MKKFLAIGLGVIAFVALLVAGIILATPDDELAAMVRPLPVIGPFAEDVVDVKSDVTGSASHFVDDTVYSITSTWRSITGFSLTDRTQRVIIELEPVRPKKPKMQKPQQTQVVPDQQPVGQSMQQMNEPTPGPMVSEAPNPMVTDAPPAAKPSMEMKPEPATPEAPMAKTEAAPEPAVAPAAPAAPETAEANEPVVDATPSTDTSAPETAANAKPDANATPEDTKEVAVASPAKNKTATPKPIRKPPPPTPKTDGGSAEHKKGLTFYKGLGGVAKNFKTAANWFRQSSAKGNAASQYNLGIMAYLGQGVEQSYGEAAKWFQQAANQDHALAQYNLGFLFYEGKGVEKDDLQAFMWIDRAARLGDEKAIKARDTLEKILPKDILKSR